MSSKQNHTQPRAATYSIPLVLTLILLTWRIWRAHNNASKWQMRFNSAFKGLREASKARFLYMYHTDHSYMRQTEMNVLHRAIIITSLKYNAYAW